MVKIESQARGGGGDATTYFRHSARRRGGRVAARGARAADRQGHPNRLYRRQPQFFWDDDTIPSLLDRTARARIQRRPKLHRRLEINITVDYYQKPAAMTLKPTRPTSCAHRTCAS